MAKKHKKASKHTVAPEFPEQGSPTDMAQHPLNNLPDPSGGAMAGMINPAMMSGMQGEQNG